MKMTNIAELYVRTVIKCIQTFNKNNTRSNNKSDKTYGILQGVINGTGRKNHKTNSTGTVKDGREKNTKISRQIVT